MTSILLDRPVSGEAVRRKPTPRMLKRQALSICITSALISLSLGYYQLLRGSNLHAILEYDDGVYFGSAVRLAHGSYPYRDYVSVHPPGITVLLAPLGLLSRAIGTRLTFEMARLLTPLVEAAGVFCVGWLVRHRRGATAVACLIMAVMADAVMTERTVMLEPYCVLGCLLGLLALFEGDRLTRSRSRLFWAGASFGIAASFELFAFFPFLVVCCALLLSTRRCRIVPFLLGGAVAFADICGGFFVLAPRSFVRDAFTAQMARTEVVLPSTWDRLLHLLGLPEAVAYSNVVGVLIVCLMVMAGVAVVVAAARLAAQSRSVSELELCVVAIAVCSAFFLLQPPAFYYHYAAFAAPFIALLIGLSAARIGLRFAAALTVFLLVAGVAHAVRFVQTHTTSWPDQSATVDARVPSHACVLGDDPADLLLANRFDCDPVVDTYGTGFVLDGGTVRSTGAASDRYWIDQFNRVTYLQLIHGFSPVRIPWDSELIGYVNAHFELVSRSPVLYARKNVTKDVSR